MKVLILKNWDRIHSSFWFVPAIMAIGAAALAFGIVTIDETVTDAWLKLHAWAYTGGAEGASLVLSTIAGSMITIAGVVFSMTLVALSLASSQLGPRLLRNFMRDPVNQTVLGTFVATFVYCLLVLRTIRRVEETLFVPHLSVTLGVLFALASLGVLIYFIHHVSVSIQADEVVARIGRELVDEIRRLFPEDRGDGGAAVSAAFLLPESFAATSRPVAAEDDGYIQRIDADALTTLAVEHKMLFLVERRTGQYVIAGSPLVRAWPGDRASDEIARGINAAFAVGRQRTSAQDIEFPIQQLVEIAVRALSPGINDPFTAIACVDRLGSALSLLSQRVVSSPIRLDKEGHLRLVMNVLTAAGIVDAAFSQLRQHARSNVAVATRLLEITAEIAPATRTDSMREALLREAEMINRGAQDWPEPEDSARATRLYQAAREALGAPVDRP